MAEIVNLNRARKAATRAERKKKAQERRMSKNGACADPASRKRARDLDGKRLDRPGRDA